MKTNSLRSVFTLLFLSFGLILFQSNTVSDVITIDIQVSPNVLNLSFQGDIVTVHTDIAYGAVVASSVTLNGVKIDHWKSDDQGNFVAKFLVSAVKNLPLIINSYNTLTLCGQTKDGVTFCGSEDIKVVKNIPKR
jgi:hypothetical protein